MCQVTVTTTTTPLLAVVCSRGFLITMTATMAPTSFGQTALGQHDVVLLPQFDSEGLNLSVTCLLRLMPIMPWILLQS